MLTYHYLLNEKHISVPTHVKSRNAGQAVCVGVCTCVYLVVVCLSRARGHMLVSQLPPYCLIIFPLSLPVGWPLH